jgi:hypothetical protein
MSRTFLGANEPRRCRSRSWRRRGAPRGARRSTAWGAPGAGRPTSRCQMQGPPTVRSTDAALRSGAPPRRASERPGKRPRPPFGRRRVAPPKATPVHRQPHPATSTAGLPRQRPTVVSRRGHKERRHFVPTADERRPSRPHGSECCAHRRRRMAGGPWPRCRCRHGARCGAPTGKRGLRPGTCNIGGGRPAQHPNEAIPIRESVPNSGWRSETEGRAGYRLAAPLRRASQPPL